MLAPTEAIRTRARIKGTLGEALVQEYFEQCGWIVATTAVERVGRHLLSTQRADAGDLAHTPDLLVVKPAGSAMNPQTHPLGQSFYVEVKTWNQWAEPQDLSKYARFGDTLLVWVSRDGIKAAWLYAVPERAHRVRDPRAVVATDFVGIAYVGGVWFRHDEDEASEAEIRAAFDAMSHALHV